MSATSVPVPRAALGLALVALGVVLGASLGGHAQASGTKVVCTQVLQGAGGRQVVDEAFLANFMSEQLAQGREHFEAVHGLSTVVCAW